MGHMHIGGEGERATKKRAKQIMHLISSRARYCNYYIEQKYMGCSSAPLCTAPNFLCWGNERPTAPSTTTTIQSPPPPPPLTPPANARKPPPCLASGGTGAISMVYIDRESVCQGYGGLQVNIDPYHRTAPPDSCTFGNPGRIGEFSARTRM